MSLWIDCSVTTSMLAVASSKMTILLFYKKVKGIGLPSRWHGKCKSAAFLQS